MAMNKVPTLVVGLGGIGCRIAAQVSDMLREEDRVYVGFVGIDTNVNDLRELEKHNIKTVQTSDERRVRNYLSDHPEYMPWFPNERFLLDRGMLNGAGQVRAISRLAGLACQASGGFQAIDDEIHRIRANKGLTGPNSLTVIVVGSITGGTGAGLFLQVPLYIRQHVLAEGGLDAIAIRGMFLGPDLTVDVQPSILNKEAVRVNAYACLKELNAMYLAQNDPEVEQSINLEYYRKSDEEAQKGDASALGEELRKLSAMGQLESDYDVGTAHEDALAVASRGATIPYDYFYVIEDATTSGTIGEEKLPAVESQVARMVHTLMFTPVGDNALSVEDNLVLQDIMEGGMNRYAGAGLWRIVFPKKVAKDYVTLRVVHDAVQREWLLLDNAYNQAVINAQCRRNAGGSDELPDLKHFYRDKFDEKSKGGEPLAKLRGEAFDNGSEDQEPTSFGDGFVQAFSDEVDKVLEGGAVTDMKTTCKVNEGKMGAFDAAKREADRVASDLVSFQKLARNTISQNATTIADDMFPASWDSLRFQLEANSKICISNWLSKVHPVVARFLIYDIMIRLEEKIEEERTALNAAKASLDALESEDYHEKEDGQQSATEAIRIIEEKQIAVIKNLKPDKKKIAKVTSKLIQNTDAAISSIVENIRASVYISNAEIILSRLEKLAQNYEVFFQSLGVMMKMNEDEMHRLEAYRSPYGETGVYCSADAFNEMAVEYAGKGNDLLPKDTKREIFLQIYHVLADELSQRERIFTEAQKEARARRKQERLSTVFKTAVVDTVRTDVTEHSGGIVDLTVRQAIAKQYCLEKGTAPELDDDFEAHLREYILTLVESGMVHAAPMISVANSTQERNTELVYLAMHPSCAELRDGTPDKGETEKWLLVRGGHTGHAAPVALINDAFSPYEMICFRARYKFKIEDLVKYRYVRGSAKRDTNEACYRRRIRNIGAIPNSAEDVLGTVSPHLNRFWHEEGYIPALTEQERRDSHQNRLLAFFYGLGRDHFVRVLDTEHLDVNGNPRRKWKFLPLGGNNADHDVTMRGAPIPLDYSALYESLLFNGAMVRKILESSRKEARLLASFGEMIERFGDIMDQPFVQDLIQSEATKQANQTRKLTDDNILDILISMRPQMKTHEWTELFQGLLGTIWEFCAIVLDDNANYINQATRKILSEILENSEAKKHQDAKASTYGEDRGIELLKALLPREYNP